MHDKRELDRRLNEAGVRPLKKLGQNFLLNPKICEQIVKETVVGEPKTVVEIGPGLGALTDSILEGSWKTVLIEMDGGLVEYWKKKKPNIEIIHKDALKLEWKDFNFSKPAVLISNLPYSIAASLVVELSSEDQPFDALILMFQKEVAERIEAPISAEDYGMLSVIAQTSWDIKKIIDAGPQDFFPVPHVGSRVLRFVPRTVDYSKRDFLKFVKLAFSQRRKKLISNLSSSYQRPKLEKVFSDLNFGGDMRAQELSPSQFIQLFKQL